METNKFFNQTLELKDILNSPTGMPLLFQYLAFLEIWALPKILPYDEQVEKIVQGNFIKRDKNSKDGKELTKSTMGVLVCSNKKMLWFSKGLLPGSDVEKYYYFNQISKIEYNKGLLFAEILIYTTGNEVAEIGSIYNRCARDFTNYVNYKLTTNT